MDMLGHAPHQQKPAHTHTHKHTHTQTDLSECLVREQLLGLAVESATGLLLRYLVCGTGQLWLRYLHYHRVCRGHRSRLIVCRREGGETLFDGLLVSGGGNGVRTRARLGTGPLNKIFSVGSQDMGRSGVGYSTTVPWSTGDGITS